MQEEVTHKTVTLSITTTRLTAHGSRAAGGSAQAAGGMEKSRVKAKIPHGKQTVKQLIGQNAGVSNIEVTDSNIKSFERVARKYGVNFAVKKDRSVSTPKYCFLQGTRRRRADRRVYRVYV